MNVIAVEKVATLTGHKDAVFALAEAEGTSKFYSAGADGYVVEWDLDKPYDGVLLCKLNLSVYALNYANGILLIGENTKGIYAVDTQSKKVVAEVKLSGETIFSIVRKGDRVFAGTSSGNLYIMNATDLSVEKVLSVSKARLRVLKVVGDDLLVGSSDAMVYHYDEKLELKARYNWHSNSVFSLQYANNTLISTGRDAQIVCSVLNEKRVFVNEQKIPAHTYAVNDLALHANGMFFASCSMDKSIKIWSLVERKLIKVIDKARHAGHGTSVNKLVWSKYNGQLISCSDDRTISVWDIKL